MSHYVYSTLSTGMTYVTYSTENNKDFAHRLKEISIAGGTGVVDKKHLETPLGVVTEITDEELEHLEKNYLFNLHKQNGFITVQARNKDKDKVVKDMNIKDKSAPLTPKDFVKKEDGSSKLLRKDL